MIFDRNASSGGTDVTHSQNTPQVTIQTPGTYEVSFHGNIGPVGTSRLPLTVSLYLQQQGTTVPGAFIQHTFQAATDSAGVAFSQILSVTSVPAVLQVTEQGGNFFYGGINLTVQKIGGTPAS